MMTQRNSAGLDVVRRFKAFDEERRRFLEYVSNRISIVVKQELEELHKRFPKRTFIVDNVMGTVDFMVYTEGKKPVNPDYGFHGVKRVFRPAMDVLDWAEDMARAAELELHDVIIPFEIPSDPVKE